MEICQHDVSCVFFVGSNRVNISSQLKDVQVFCMTDRHSLLAAKNVRGTLESEEEKGTPYIPHICVITWGS